jgi:argininosuccinate lyase
VVKSPSARSDNLIFAYGEVPRALELASRVTRLMSGVIRTLRVNTSRMADALTSGFTQATDLAEHIVTVCRIDYRTAYLIVGRTVREAAAKGLRGVDITGEMLDNVSVQLEGRPLGLAGHDLSGVLDPKLIVLTRSAQGGAAPAAVEAMVQACGAEASALHSAAAGWTKSFATAEETLLATAREITETQEVAS